MPQFAVFFSDGAGFGIEMVQAPDAAQLCYSYRYQTALKSMSFRNLAAFPFNNQPNTAISDGGWYVVAGGTVEALARGDTIIGISDAENVGIEIVGTLDTGSGNDIVLGKGDGKYGIYSAGGTLNTGSGSDTITGVGKVVGFVNTGSIDTNSGADTIAGKGGTDKGIINEGSIIGGAGSDTIKGESKDGSGIFNASLLDPEVGDYLIDCGSGDDLVTGKSDASAGVNNFGIINGGKGNDTITGTGLLGIQNLGTINGGSGKDTIRGIGGIGIFNQGFIDTGAGDDTVDALNGGFVGRLGKTYLGDGSDRLLGFGDGEFYGGSGVDKILFSQGNYTISGSSIISEGVSMTVNEFEKIGGSNGGIFNFADGTLTVNANGVATFAA